MLAFIVCSASTYSQNKLKGNVHYDDVNETKLANVTVSLADSLSNILYSTTTNSSGKYELKNIPNGTYNLQFSTNNPWSGGTITDALRIFLYMNNFYSLSPMQYTASDVNGNGIVDMADAYLIVSRYLQQTTSFPTGDWIFENSIVTLGSKTTIERDVKGRNTGDNDDVYTPPTSKEPFPFTIEDDECIIASSNQYLSMDVKINNDINIGALGFVISYPSSLVRIEEITSPFDEINYSIGNNEIRFSWLNSSLEPINLNKSHVIFTIKLQTTSEFTKDKIIKFQIHHDSEVSNPRANKLFNINIAIPRIICTPEKSLLSQNYPNPFSSTTQIEYELTDEASSVISIFDIFGKKVFEISNPKQSIGNYKISFDGSNLETGLYFYRIEISGAKLNYSEARKMLIIR